MKLEKKSVVAGIVSFASAAALALELATPFADNMVLQRERPVRVWGTAEPGESVTVVFAGQSKSTTADAGGAWRVSLDPMAASKENRVLTASGATASKSVRNVLVGEVWFASGQSNMECPIWGPNPRYRDGKGAMMTRATKRPFIRYVKTPKAWSVAPRRETVAVWRDFSPASFKADFERNLSAVAFYYALELYDALDVPVGIIDSSWGGTNIDAWTPRAGYARHPELKDVADFPVTDRYDKSMNVGPISGAHQQPTVLWNGMVSAWAPFAIRGLIWYQGCNNAGEPRRYAQKMHALYDGWAQAFENSDLKLYFVQLAPYKKNFHGVRLAQAQFAAEEKNAAMAVVCDAGNWDDIHPNDKEIVARRLALHALRRDYGFTDVRNESPTLKAWRVEDGKFVLSFENATAWYVYRENSKMDVPGFEVAGPDGKFVAAKVLNENSDRRGTLAGAELVVAAEGVDRPCRLRYLATAPYAGSLYSFDSGLPLGPFEIDAREANAGRRDGGTAFGDALKVPELAGYRRILAAELPVYRAFRDVGYTFDDCAHAGDFSRVAYVLELERTDGTVDWAVAAFDAFTREARRLGVPCSTGTVVQQEVENLVVRSNIARVAEGARGKGIVEFFSTNYSTGGRLASCPGDDGKYDFNDTPQREPDPGYGSMQVHDAARGETVFAYNRFNGGIPDIGIGPNLEGEHPDWTFMGNADIYKSRRLTVLVK